MGITVPAIIQISVVIIDTFIFEAVAIKANTTR